MNRETRSHSCVDAKSHRWSARAGFPSGRHGGCGFMLAFAGCGGSKAKGTGGAGGSSAGGSAGSISSGVGGGSAGDAARADRRAQAAAPSPAVSRASPAAPATPATAAAAVFPALRTQDLASGPASAPVRPAPAPASLGPARRIVQQHQRLALRWAESGLLRRNPGQRRWRDRRRRLRWPAGRWFRRRRPAVTAPPAGPAAGRDVQRLRQPPVRPVVRGGAAVHASLECLTVDAGASQCTACGGAASPAATATAATAGSDATGRAALGRPAPARTAVPQDRPAAVAAAVRWALPVVARSTAVAERARPVAAPASPAARDRRPVRPASAAWCGGGDQCGACGASGQICCGGSGTGTCASGLGCAGGTGRRHPWHVRRLRWNGPTLLHDHGRRRRRRRGQRLHERARLPARRHWHRVRHLRRRRPVLLRLRQHGTCSTGFGCAGGTPARACRGPAARAAPPARPVAPPWAAAATAASVPA